MSAYITLATPMVDQECLLAALTELGFAAEHIEVHDQAVPLVGFEGDRRTVQGHVVIRKQHVGRASNDLGFERTATGYRAHVSDHDRSRYGPGWMAKLHERYQVHDGIKRARLEREAREAAIEARRLAELEMRRREEERQRLVEAQRQAVRDKARKLGYRVKETREGETLRLVLVKRVY